jgi:SPP1 gp7 family putative phage head morphogenesis protein
LTLPELSPLVNPWMWSNLDASPRIPVKKRQVKFVMRNAAKPRRAAVVPMPANAPPEMEFETVGDTRVCPLCEELDGHIFDADDASIPALPVHPNCRCILVDNETGEVVLDAEAIELNMFVNMFFSNDQTDMSKDKCQWVTLKNGIRICLKPRAKKPKIEGEQEVERDAKVEPIKPKFGSEVSYMFSQRPHAESECTWVTIRGNPVCISDRDGDGKGDLPEKFGKKTEGPKARTLRTPTKRESEYQKSLETDYGKNQGKGEIFVVGKIEVSDTPTEHHKEVGADVAERHPNGKGAEYYAEQARKVDQIRAKAEDVALKEYDKFKKDFPDADVMGRIKSVYSATEKIPRKNMGGAEDLRDIIGMRVIAPEGSTLQEYRAIAEKIRAGKEAEGSLIKFEDVSERAKNDMGLRGIHIDYVDKATGQQIELQVKTTNQDDWGAYVHDRIFKPPKEHRTLVDGNREEFNRYALDLSEYYYQLDSGNKQVNKPACPRIIESTFGCAV